MINKEHIPLYANSNGYFKDPSTGEWLTGLEPRSVSIAITETGSLVWPEVKVSSGESVKIVYKLWTDEEKQVYKKYRATPKLHKEKQQKPAKQDDYVVPPVAATIVDYDRGEVYTEVPYDWEAAASGNALSIIKQCNELLDVVQYAGLTYARLLCLSEPKKIYCVPKALITEAEMKRLKCS